MVPAVTQPSWKYDASADLTFLIVSAPISTLTAQCIPLLTHICHRNHVCYVCETLTSDNFHSCGQKQWWVIHKKWVCRFTDTSQKHWKNHYCSIERMYSRDQRPYLFNETKSSFCITRVQLPEGWLATSTWRLWRDMHKLYTNTQE